MRIREIGLGVAASLLVAGVVSLSGCSSEEGAAPAMPTGADIKEKAIEIKDKAAEVGAKAVEGTGKAMEKTGQASCHL